MDTIAPYIGIDFGTSKSSMAWYDHRIGRAEIILNAQGKLITPSVVYLGGPAEDQILVGEPAERKLKQENVEQRRFVLSVKRDLMRAWNKVLDSKIYTPVKVASIILAKLREDADKQHFKQPVERAVITHPASFDPQQQDKIREAAKLAGFREVELLPEPVAAALTYASTGLKVGNYVMVYDFGGGTFDVAVLERVSNSKFRRAASRGLPSCGGDDLDNTVYAYCEEIVRREMNRRSISLNEETDIRFLRSCRECKENLTAEPAYTFSYYLPSQNGRVLFERTLDRPTFEGGIQVYIDNTVSLTKEVLREAEKKSCKVDTVILVGGSSRVPLVQRSLSAALPVKSEPWQYQDVAVAMGAAYHAQQLWGTKSSSPLPPPVVITGPLSIQPSAPVSSPPPSAPPSPVEQYRSAVKEAWATKTLTTTKVNKLKAEIKRLHLNNFQAAAIEREIMAGTKESILATKLHQDALADYRKAVRKIQASQLTQQQVDELAAQARKLELSSNEAAAIEREILKATKEESLRRLQATVVPPRPTPPPPAPTPTFTPRPTPTPPPASVQPLRPTPTFTFTPRPTPTPPPASVQPPKPAQVQTPATPAPSTNQTASQSKKKWKFTASKFFAFCLIGGAGYELYLASSSTTSSPQGGVYIYAGLIIVGLFWFFHKNRTA